MNTTLKTLQNALGVIGTLQVLALRIKIALSGLRNPSQHGYSEAETLNFANSSVPAGFIGFANDFVVLQDNWIQIPYGDYSHPGPVDPRNGRPIFPQGCVQRFNNAAGAAMLKSFNDEKASKGAAFGGLPWYVGHHDVDPIKYPDPASYAWVMALDNRADAFYMQAKWTDDGDKLKSSGKFKFFSPYWNGIDTGERDSQGRAIIMPNVLESVAFTNNPNIPVLPLANEEQRIAMANEVTAANLFIDRAVDRGVLLENDRKDWVSHFAEDFESAAWALANAGTREGALKGWETRRAGMAAKAAKLPKNSAKVTAKAMKASGKKVKISQKALKTQREKNLAAATSMNPKAPDGEHEAALDRGEITHTPGDKSEARLAAQGKQPPPLPMRSAAVTASSGKTGGFLRNVLRSFTNPNFGGHAE